MNEKYKNSCPETNIEPKAFSDEKTGKWVVYGYIMPPKRYDTLRIEVKTEINFNSEEEANNFFLNYFLLK